MQNDRSRSDNHRLPSIAHVEVAGSWGGSVLCLELYLRHCNPAALNHHALFYKQPPTEQQHNLSQPWPVTELGLPAPTASSTGPGGSRRALRGVLARVPRLRAFLREIHVALKALADIPRAIRLARVFRAGGYDLVHSNNNFDYQVPTLLGAWLARKPVVAHVRTPRPLNWWRRRLSRIPVQLIAINQAVADDLLRQKIKTPIVICHDPCAEPVAAPERVRGVRRELVVGGGEVLIGAVCRLEAWKGIDDLLETARLLRVSWPCVRYVVVGSGAAGQHFRELAAQWGLLDIVRFAGYQRDPHAYAAACDIFVNASRVEGGPLVVLEAMMLGLPVVSTRVGMVPEWITHGEDGLIVAPSDPRALAQALETLLRDAAMRRTLGERAARRARRLGDPVVRARELDQVFRDLLRNLGHGEQSSRELETSRRMHPEQLVMSNERRSLIPAERSASRE
jgi:glycosyltransferase involved in cell wall biosynthesis